MIPGQGGISRRSVLKMMAAAGATTVAASQWPRGASSASRLVVGAAYVGPITAMRQQKLRGNEWRSVRVGAMYSHWY